jgi:hypothetical protein
MNPNPASAAVRPSGSDAGLRRLSAAMSVFTMLMTIPQVLTIWIGQQAAGVFYLHVERLPGFRHPLVMVRNTEKRQKHLLAVRGLDRTRSCCDHGSNHLWLTRALGSR